MLVKLTEIMSTAACARSVDAYNIKNEYVLREVYISREQVVLIRKDENLVGAHKRQPLIEKLDARTSFTKVLIDAGSNYPMSLSVIGAPKTIAEKLGL